MNPDDVISGQPLMCDSELKMPSQLTILTFTEACVIISQKKLDTKLCLYSNNCSFTTNDFSLPHQCSGVKIENVKSLPTSYFSIIYSINQNFHSSHKHYLFHVSIKKTIKNHLIILFRQWKIWDGKTWLWTKKGQ